MTKQEFLDLLKSKLDGLPKKESTERIAFYSEMIDDLIEDGLSEGEAVNKIGPADKVASQIVAETPVLKIIKGKLKPKKSLSTLELVLLIVGSPVWVSLLIAALAVVFSLYVSLWALVISLWACLAAIGLCAVFAFVAGIVLIFSKNALTGFALIGVGLACAGLAVFLYYGCKYATNGAVKLSGRIILSTKKLLAGKGRKI